MTRKRRRHTTTDPSATHPQQDVSARHVPVLLSQVLMHLAPVAGGRYLDATFGAGGYTEAILNAADCRVLALDRDPTAIAGGRALQDRFGARLELRDSAFGELSAELDLGPASFDGVVFDLGVSSMQLDEAERGFSFQSDGPLDMRMFSAPGEPMRESGPSAADIVNTAAESLLADIIYQLGEDRRSRAIAGAIVKRRAEQPFERTADLAAVVKAVIGRHAEIGKHPATRTFQALRLYVNDELGQLARGLAAAELLLQPGGRLVVVTFHSLEDRIVKQFLAARSGRAPGLSRHSPQVASKQDASFRIINSKALKPDDAETWANPRSRSAKLRAAERTSARSWSFDIDAFGLPSVSTES